LIYLDSVRYLNDRVVEKPTLVADKDSAYKMRGGIPGSPDHVCRANLSGFGPDRRMRRPDSATAEDRRPQ
jgi:hypothetical protein